MSRSKQVASDRETPAPKSGPPKQDATKQAGRPPADLSRLGDGDGITPGAARRLNGAAGNGFVRDMVKATPSATPSSTPQADVRQQLGANLALGGDDGGTGDPDAVGVGGYQLQQVPGRDGADQPEPSPEQLQAGIADARRAAAQQPEAEVCADGDATAEPAVTPAPPAGIDPQAASVAGQGGGEVGRGDAGGGAPPFVSGEGPLLSFQQAKGGPLRDWDDEVAWHDYFAGGGGPGGGIRVDRGQLVMDALGGGLKDGAAEGLKNLGIDIALNVASSKVPYLSGFVEMAKLAYDPEAYVQGMLSNTAGKMSLGGGQMVDAVKGLAGGDMWAAVDLIEGVLNVADGANNVIGTISSILWIVAAAGFVLSFLCPALIPFVGMAAQWAYTLGGIGTLIGLWITAARALVMGLKSLQILYADASPEDLLDQGERLRGQTSQFSQEFTQNAGNSLRNRASDRINRALEPKPANAPETARTSAPRENPSTRMEKIVSVLSGSMGGAGDSITSGAGRQREDASGRVDTLRQTRQAYLGQGRYQGGATGADGKRTTAQTVADMEDAGATMFHSEKQRERVQGQLDERGQGAFQRRPQQDAVLEAAQAKVQAAQSDLDEAKGDTRAARDRLRTAQAELEKAQDDLRRTADDHAGAISAKQSEVAARKELLDETRSLSQRANAEVEYHREMVQTAQAYAEAHPSPHYDAILAQTRADLARAEQHAAQLSAQVREAQAYHQEGVQALEQARRPVQDAQARVDTATTARNDANNAHSDATERERSARTGRGAARDELADVKPPPGGLSREAWDERQDKISGYNPWTDFSGEGPTNLHGHNQASGVMGGGTDFLRDRVNDKAWQKPAFGAWEKTLDGQAMDLSSSAGQRGADGDAKNYKAELQERYDTLKATLQAPPAGAPDVVDHAATDFAARTAEAEQVGEGIQVLEELKAEGQTEVEALALADRIAAANAEAVRQHDEQLGAKQQRQTELQGQAGQVQGQAAAGQGQAAQGKGQMDGMMSGLLKVFGLVPSQLTGNGGAGASGAQQLQTGLGRQAETTGQGADTAQNVAAAATDMTSRTQAGRTDAAQMQGTLQGVQGEAQARRADAESGVADIDAALLRGRARLEAITAEKGDLRTRHDQSIQEMQGWVGTHRSQRQAGLGELDGIVKLAGGK